MATVDSISTQSTVTASTPKGMSALSSEDFSKIIFSELSHQDPLSPNDTNALLQQVSTLRSIQADTDLSDRLKSLVQQNQFASGASLLGKKVSGLATDQTRVQGTVRSVSNTKDGPVVTLDTGARVSMSQLDEVDAATAGS
jgi:flagellar hook assembly protein FlgD